MSKTIYKEKIGYKLGNKYDIGDVVYFTDYKGDKMHIYKSVVVAIKRIECSSLTGYGERVTDWWYEVKGKPVDLEYNPGYDQPLLFKSLDELKNHYYQIALHNANQQNEEWDEEETYLLDQEDCNDFGIRLQCKPVWRRGAITRKIQDLT